MSRSHYVFGFHAARSHLRMRPESVHEIYVDAARLDARMREFTDLAKAKNIRVMAVDTKRLDGMTGGAARHQGIVMAVEPIQLAQFIDDVLDVLTVPPLLLVLDGITDPHNLGACLRVADAAGVHAVIAPKDRSVGLTATAIKVASGAAQTVPYITVTNMARTLRELKARDIRVIGADEKGNLSLYDITFTGALAWVLGAEGEGLRRLTREHCDDIVSIPLFGAVESLNVSVASGICLFETRRQLENVAKKQLPI